jgi:hypothetical protein
MKLTGNSGFSGFSGSRYIYQIRFGAHFSVATGPLKGVETSVRPLTPLTPPNPLNPLNRFHK